MQINMARSTWIDLDLILIWNHQNNINGADSVALLKLSFIKVSGLIIVKENIVKPQTL